MEISFNKNDENNNDNYKLITQNENEKTKSPKLKSKISSPKKQYKESSFMSKKFSLIDEIKKSKEERMTKSDNKRKASMSDDLRRGEIKKFDLEIDKKEGKIKKKDGVNRKFLRKNPKKSIPSKYKRKNNFVNKIKVVGTVSAKLNALIQRLEQNNASAENTSSNQYGNKVVMAPRIKAALEKFNKKKEEKPEIIHYDNGHQKYKRKNKASQEEKDIREDLSNGDNYENENYEEEYEEDEDCEEEVEEEEDEGEEKDDDIQNQKRIYRRNAKIRTIKKRRTRDNDSGKKLNEINDNMKDNIKKKKRKRGKDNNSKDEEDEYDDEYSNLFDEHWKKKRIERKKKKDNSKGNSSQESEECDDEEEYEEGIIAGKSSNNENSFDVSKKYRKKKKKRNFEFSEDKSEKNGGSDKKKNLKENGKENNKREDFNNEQGIIRLKKELVCHKSGHGDTIIKSTSKGDIFYRPEEKESNKKENDSINKINIRNDSFPSQNPINMIQKRTSLVKKQNVNNGGISKTIENKGNKSDNLGSGIILTIKKRFVKNIEYEKFLYKNYVITDFKSKSNGKKNIKEILKYIPFKQAVFTLYANYENNNDDVYDKKIVKGKVDSSSLKKSININDNMNNKNNKLNNINDENNDYKNNGIPPIDSSYNDDISSKIQSYKIINNIIDENSKSFIDNTSINEYKNNQNNNGQKYTNAIKYYGNNETENGVQNRISVDKHNNNIIEDISANHSKNYKNTINNYNNMNIDILDDNNKNFNSIVLNKTYKNSLYNDKELIEKNFDNTKNKISSKNYNNNVHNSDNDKIITDYFLNSNIGKYYNNNDINEEVVKNYKNEISVIKGNNNNEDLNDDQIIVKNIGEMKKYNKISGDIKENSMNWKNSVSMKNYMKNGDINGNKENILKNYKSISIDKYYNNNGNNDDIEYNSKKNKYDISLKKYNKNNNVLDDTSNLIENDACRKKYNNNIILIENKNKVSMEKKNNNVNNLDYDLKSFKTTISMIKNKKIMKDFDDNSKTFKINMKKDNKSDIDANPISIKNVIQTIKNNSINEMNENSQYNNNFSEKIYINNNGNDELKKKVIINNQSRKIYKNSNVMDEKVHLNSISANNYNICHFEKKLNEIERIKEELLNKNININNEFKKRQKRYQSILLSDGKDFLELSNNLNEINKNNGVLEKNRNLKRKKMSVFQIVKRRGIIGNVEDNENLENMNTDSEKTKKVQFNNLNTKKPIQNDKENIKINKSKDGEKYILFKFKADLKKINKKEKWILEPSETNSFTLK